jgi:molybdate transport system ATP-binding protein
LIVRFEQVRLSLSDFDVVLDAGISANVTALFGPSGSGKTSILELIAGVRRPAFGRIYLRGEDVTGRPARERHVGYVPQDDALFPHLSVGRNIRYGSSGDDSRIEQILEVLEIGPLVRRAVRSLSGGERKRVALARALATAPALLLLDEPLAGVDHQLRDRILTYLRRVRAEFAIPMIYVAHDPAEVRSIADEIVVIERGRIRNRDAMAASPDGATPSL